LSGPALADMRARSGAMPGITRIARGLTTLYLDAFYCDEFKWIFNSIGKGNLLDDVEVALQILTASLAAGFPSFHRQSPIQPLDLVRRDFASARSGF
jgi:hypothetical protein